MNEQLSEKEIADRTREVSADPVEVSIAHVEGPAWRPATWWWSPNLRAKRGARHEMGALDALAG